MTRIGKYLSVESFEEISGCWFVLGGRGGCLGGVEWHDRWKCYVFAPEIETEFSADCLRDIAAFMDARTKERKEKK